MDTLFFWIGVVIAFTCGAFFGISCLAMCRVAANSDKDSKIYELRSKLEVERFKNRQYPIEGAD